MSISSFYDNKKILITGVTGFVGKVLLEKFLWSLPNTDKFFLLIRNKEGSSLMERFKKEIFESACFNRLREVHKSGFESWFFEKVHPISGDLLKDRLGLSEQDENYIIENIDVIINSAASVDFNARIDDAINTNTLGTLRVYNLAKKCKKIANFLHVSTAYVNSDKRGYIEEEVYPIDTDPELLLNNLLSMPLDELIKKTQSIIGQYPNTYTFTKSLTERIINKEKGKYTVTILRPTIIGSSFKEPFPGWVDTVSAAGALYLLGGIGVLKYAPGNKNKTVDQIPVDYVANGIISSVAYYANCKTLNVLHSGTSEKNPTTLEASNVVIITYWREFRSEKSIGLPYFEMVSSPLLLELKLLKTEIPAYIYSFIANKFGSVQMKKNAHKLTKMLERSRTIGEMFRAFLSYEWIFSTKNLSKIEESLSIEDREKFDLDVTKIEWVDYLRHFAWGLKKFVLKEDCDPPSNVKRLDLISKKKNLSEYFTEMRKSLSSDTIIQTNNKNLINKIISSSKIKKLIEIEGKDAEKRAQDICKIMFAEYNVKTLRLFAWSLQKLFQKLYEKIVIDENQIKVLKQLEKKGPLILAPNHLSYIDFLVISYIFYQYGLKCPYVHSNEELLSITFITKLLRASGAFVIKNKIRNDYLYKAIFIEYINSLLDGNCNLEIFIESSRSRSGKLTKFANETFDIFLTSYYNNEITNKNLHIVPISINYERVIEGEKFPYELLGETKVKESFTKLISSVNIFKDNHGRIFVEFCDPINLISYTKSSEPVELQVSKIKSTILNELNNKSVVMPTSILASILLMHRKGGVSEDHLIKRTEWLGNELLKRNKKMGSFSDTSSHIPVRNAIKLLETITVRKKDMFGLNVTPKVDYKNILLLSYYRNALLNTFANEAIMACALAGFGHQISWKEGADINRLIEENNFICNLLEKEFIFNTTADETLNIMTKFNILKIEDQKIRVIDDLMVSFLCSLIWPFVESYWVSVLYLFSLKNKEGLSIKKLVEQIQWFAESMHDERILEAYESCSQDSIKKAVKTYRVMGVLKKDPKTKNYSLNTSEEQIRDLENHINKFLKITFANSMDSPIDVARKSVLLDFPFIAKL